VNAESDDFSAWVGRTERVEDPLCPTQARAAAALFDDASAEPSAEPSADLGANLSEGTPLPPLWHWFYFLPRAPQSMLDTDGHPQRGGFLPPIPYPRRMFAGSKLRFHQPLLIGRPAERHATIAGVSLKSGRTGPLAFVTVAIRFEQNGILCIEEEQQIVYREPGARVPPPATVAWPALPPAAQSRLVTPDPRMLFRFSALTFNAHRIHYDRDYAAREEGYPGLVVHGPLTAMLLMHAARATVSKPLVGFSFRGQAPLFDLAPFRLVVTPDGSELQLEAQRSDGQVALAARAEFAA
jgi:3-methylfumaryl-CoA hydratase